SCRRSRGSPRGCWKAIRRSRSRTACWPSSTRLACSAGWDASGGGSARSRRGDRARVASVLSVLHARLGDAGILRVAFELLALLLGHLVLGVPRGLAGLGIGLRALAL